MMPIWHRSNIASSRMFGNEALHEGKRHQGFARLLGHDERKLGDDDAKQGIQKELSIW